MSWTNEDRLLLYCCRAENGESTNNRIKEAARNGLDWDRFLEKSRENGISPLIFFRLNKIVKDNTDIPSDILEKLKGDYYLNAARNILIFKKLGAILEEFRQAGLEVIVLKGAALAETIYRNLALRLMTDLDLLVRKEDLSRIDEQLKILGYYSSDILVNDIDFSSTYLTTLDYRSSTDNSLSLHIHWHFVNSSIPNESYIKNINMENIWRDAEKIPIANVETRVMAPHHLLIHLSEHALRVTHSLSKISFFFDIHEAVNFHTERLDWDRLIKDSFKFNLNRMVYISLYFTSKFMQTKIPEDVLADLRPKRFFLGEKIFLNHISNNNRFSGMSYLVHLSMNRGLFKKMNFVERTLFPPRRIISQKNYAQDSKFSWILYVRRINEIFSRLFNLQK